SLFRVSVSGPQRGLGTGSPGGVDRRDLEQRPSVRVSPAEQDLTEQHARVGARVSGLDSGPEQGDGVVFTAVGDERCGVLDVRAQSLGVARHGPRRGGLVEVLHGTRGPFSQRYRAPRKPGTLAVYERRPRRWIV